MRSAVSAVALSFVLVVLAGCSPVGYIVGGAIVAFQGGGGGSDDPPPVLPPFGVSATSQNPGEVVIDWAEVTGADSYVIYWSTSPGVTKVSGTAIPTPAPPHIHDGLTNGTIHYYVVTTVRGSQESGESPEVFAMPLSAPTAVTTAGQTSQVTISWSIVPGATAYNVYWSTTQGVNRANGTRIPGVTSPYLHGSLIDGTTYYYVVTAVNTAGGGAESDESAEAAALPLALPTGLAATGATGQITLDWAAVSGADAYNLYWSTSPGVTPSTGNPLPGVTPPYTHTGLASNTTYHYVATAVSFVGGGTESDPSSETSQATTDAPANVIAIGATSQVTVTWDPVVGATSYNIYWSTMQGVTKATGTLMQGVTSPFVHTPLANGNPYYYIVTAVQVGGSESAGSTETSAVPLAVPTGLTAVGSTGSINLAWNGVTGANGYRIYWLNTSGVTPQSGTLISTPAPPFTHAGLTNGISYYYVVTATSSVGGTAESLPSAEAGQSPIAAPGGVVATGATSQTTVTWSAVAGATSYDIYWSPNPGVTKVAGTRLPGVASPYVHPGLSNGVPYYYVVVALSSAGGGAESIESTEATAIPLSAPSGVSVTGGDGQLTLDWNGVTGASTYNVYWLTAPGVTKLTGTRMAGQSAPFMHSSLSNGTTYHYVVTATSAVGGGSESADSGEVSQTPVGPPTGITAQAGDGQVSINWLDGPGATFHDIYWSTSPGVTKSSGTKITGAVRPYVHSPLPNGTNHYYVVVSVNAGGESGESGEVAARPITAPTGLTVTASGAGELTIDWVGSLGADSHNLYWSASPGVNKTNGTEITAVSAPYVHMGLTNGDLYYYVVTAANSVGLGVESAESGEDSNTPEMLGVLDTSFGGQGWIVNRDAAGGTGSDIGWGIAVDSQGRILVAGESASSTSGQDLAVWRFLPSDGSPDPTFGTSGVVLHNSAAGGNGSDSGRDLVIDGSGRILVVGESAGATTGRDLAIWCFDSGGGLFPSFGSGGIVTAHNAAGGNADDRGRGIAIAPSGRIYATGWSRNGSGNDDMALWAFDSTGSPDSGFAGGVLSHDGAAGGTGRDVGYMVVADGLSQPVVVGSSRNAAGDDDMVLWRFTPAGLPSISFGSGGVVVRGNSAGGNGTDRGFDVILDVSGRILASGDSFGTGGNAAMAIWRSFSANGGPDTTFDGDGWAIDDVGAGGGGTDVGYSLAIDSFGRILAAGFSTNIFGNLDAVLWRYNSNGTPDLGFGPGGLLVHHNAAGGNESDYAYSVVLDASERVLICGASRNAAFDFDMVVWRYK